jgi:hypothetical protein
MESMPIQEFSKSFLITVYAVSLPRFVEQRIPESRDIGT